MLDIGRGQVNTELRRQIDLVQEPLSVRATPEVESGLASEVF